MWIPKQVRNADLVAGYQRTTLRRAKDDEASLSEKIRSGQRSILVSIGPSLLFRLLAFSPSFTSREHWQEV